MEKLKKADEGLSIKERDLQKHLESELQKVDGVKLDKKEKENKTVITEEQIYKDLQLKTAQLIYLKH